MRSILNLLLLMVTQAGMAQTSGHLFLITENGKFGYINEKAEVVIAPRFLSAGDFSEGLAAVREKGVFGYINEKGVYVIPPTFDYAEAFHQGLAVVYRNGVPAVLNMQGKMPFQCSFMAIGPYRQGRAEVTSLGGKHGFIDKNGKLLIDTVFLWIRDFKEGLALVEGPSEAAGSNQKVQIGLIDSVGRFVINYGRYLDIEGPEAGYVKVRIAPEPWDTINRNTERTAFLNKEGKLIYSKDNSHHSYIAGNLHCGLIPIRLSHHPNDTLEDYEDGYKGYINLKGEITISDTNYVYATNFSENRAFVGGKNFLYNLIDTHGKIYAKNLQVEYDNASFKNGLALVSEEGKWGVIDTNGNYVIKPQFDFISWVSNTTDYFIFRQKVEIAGADSHTLYGVINRNGSIMVPPIMQDIGGRGFVWGLLTSIVEGKLTYINSAGKIMWQEKTISASPLKKLNIDYMNRGYFYAFSKPLKHANGGYGRSDNWPQKNKKADFFPKRCLSVIVHPEQFDTARFDHCLGVKVYIANTSKASVLFNASDSRLYMKVQAINTKGEWKDIEYLPSSWCGNSYHILTLNANCHWSFTMPVYEGDFKTRLRVELQYIDPTDTSTKRWEKRSITIYSNEFEGSINPAQFWRKPGYTPGGIMDPYLD